MFRHFNIIILLYHHFISNFNTVKIMLRLCSWFLVAFLISIHYLQRQMLYFKYEKEVTNLSLAVLLGQVSSIVYCAWLCFSDDHFMEFFYSETRRHCIRLQCVMKESYSYQYAVPGISSNALFRKRLTVIYDSDFA